MNPEHAVDIYFDFVENEVTFLRRRDSMHLVLKEFNEAKSIGHAAFEAIEPKISNELPWQKTGDNWRIEWDNLDIVVAWRDQGSLVVATPLCGWGKAPDIKVKNQPSYLELGAAIIEQRNYAKRQREQHV